MRIITPAAAEQGKRPQRTKITLSAKKWPALVSLTRQLLVGRSRRGICKKCRPLARSCFGSGREVTCPALRRGPIEIKHLGYFPSKGSSVFAHHLRPRSLNKLPNDAGFVPTSIAVYASRPLCLRPRTAGLGWRPRDTGGCPERALLSNQIPGRRQDA